MFQRRLHSWLTALADPEGKAPPPSAALNLDQFEQFWPLAEYHGVLPACLANMKNLADSVSPDRIVRSVRPGQAPRELLPTAMAEARETLFRGSASALAMRHQAAELGDAFCRHGISLPCNSPFSFQQTDISQKPGSL